MSGLNVALSVTLVLLSIMWSGRFVVAKSKVSRGPVFHVQLHNDLPAGTPLNIHCKSKDDNLGSHSINPHHYYSWRFRPNIWGTTLFWCTAGYRDGFRGPYMSKSFNAYNGKRDDKICGGICEWHAQKDGLYRVNKGKMSWMYNWDSKQKA